MNFIPKVFCLFLAYSLLLTAAGCTRSAESSATEASSATQSSELEESLPPTPAYAERSTLPEGYTLDTSGFDPVYFYSDGNRSFIYDVRSPHNSLWHNSTQQGKSFPYINASPIVAMFALDPTGATPHPMMLFVTFSKDIAEQTGKLKIGEDIYSKEELTDYLVYSDSAYEIYQVQPLACGQPFTDCWDQLMQHARDMRKDKDCKWPNYPLKIERNEYLLEAYTYFSEHVSELIIPPQADSVSSEANDPK